MRADIDPLVVWSSCVAPGARSGRGSVVPTSTALKSSSVIVNGPARLERADARDLPSLDEPVAPEGQVPRPAQDQPVLAVEVRQRLVQLRPRLVVRHLEQPLVREVVDRARERVVHVEHVALREPLLQAGLQRVVPGLAVRDQHVRAFVFVEPEQRPRSSGEMMHSPGSSRRSQLGRRRPQVHELLLVGVVVVAGEPAARHARARQEAADRVDVEAPGSG